MLCGQSPPLPDVEALSRAVKLGPDGVFLSNGPADPAAVTYGIEATREILGTDIPVFGICLGHQLMGLLRARRPSR